MATNPMEIKDPVDTLGRGSGPGMRAGRNTEGEKDPKKYMGFNFPESFIRDLKLAATVRGHECNPVRPGQNGTPCGHSS